MNGSSKKKAVALKYEPEVNQAPQVIAKGQGIIAEQIIEKAKENRISIHEDQALVQILSQLELNKEIPPELYSIIAEIFALVYQAEQMAEKRKLL